MSAGQTTQTWFPWQGTKSTVGTWTRDVDSGQLGMGFWDNAGAQNDETNNDLWLDSGTWKVALTYETAATYGIDTIQFNGVTQGTVDFYSAGVTHNLYAEVTGLSVATAKIVTLKHLVATKNASSSNYRLAISSIALIKTAGAHTSGGTDTPGYTVEIIPWAGSKANTTWNTRGQVSTMLGGGNCTPDAAGAQNSAISWDIELDTGTYKYAELYQNGSTSGIATIQLGGVSKGTIDHYVASGTQNNYSEVTGITVASSAVVTFQILMATKNASSTSYQNILQSASWVRTGA